MLWSQLTNILNPTSPACSIPAQHHDDGWQSCYHWFSWLNQTLSTNTGIYLIMLLVIDIFQQGMRKWWFQSPTNAILHFNRRCSLLLGKNMCPWLRHHISTSLCKWIKMLISICWGHSLSQRIHKSQTGKLRLAVASMWRCKPEKVAHFPQLQAKAKFSSIMPIMMIVHNITAFYAKIWRLWMFKTCPWAMLFSRLLDKYS